MSAMGLPSALMPKLRQAERIAASSASPAPTRSSPRWDDRETRFAPIKWPSPPTSTTSVFESPPSTARIDANDLLNAALRFLDIGDQSAVRQVGQRRVRVRMVADQVPCSRDRSGYIWVGAGPAPLDEEGRGHLARGKQREDPLGCAGRALAATGMFGVKGQGDAQITHAL